MSAVAGIDFSSYAVDVVLVHDTGRVEWHRFPLNGGGLAFDRTRTVRTVMPPRSGAFWDPVTLIGIEEPMGPSNIIGPLKAVQGAILSCLPARTLVEPIQPARWRKAVGLAGNATKDQVAVHAMECLGAPTNAWPQDAYDALSIARAVETIAVTTAA